MNTITSSSTQPLRPEPETYHRFCHANAPHTKKRNMNKTGDNITALQNPTPASEHIHNQSTNLQKEKTASSLDRPSPVSDTQSLSFTDLKLAYPTQSTFETMWNPTEVRFSA